MRSCTIVYTSLKNSVASTHAIRVFSSLCRLYLCTSLYIAKKSYFTLSSLSEFLRASAFCARVLLCTRRLKIPSHLRTLSEFLKSRATRLTAHLKATYVHSENSCTSMYTRIFFRTRVTFICTIIRIALWSMPLFCC